MHVAEMRIIGLSGSLRRNSYNTAALLAARNLLPPNVTFEIVPLDNLPLFNADTEQAGVPIVVTTFRERLRTADALLLATPEYNFSTSAVLKNALEWASRPPNPPVNGKPCALLGASTSPLGTARGQFNLRQVCVSLNLIPVNVPHVDITDAKTKYDSDNRLTDRAALESIKQLLNELTSLSRRLSSANE
jgi:chromate reductase